jgi:hypothetical protein
LPEDRHRRGHRRRWADRTRWSLDDKLAEVPTEIEARAEAAEQRRAAAEHAKAYTAITNTCRTAPKIHSIRRS